MEPYEIAPFEIVKSSGRRAKFSVEKLRASLRRSGASKKVIDQIIDRVRDELYQGISTREIYNRAFAMLKRQDPLHASKYKLKKAIYELGPTGFPFERFVGAIFLYSGYDVSIGKIVKGRCVSHEVDVVARKNNDFLVIECKFHGEEGRNCDVKIPLYINSRYKDILEHYADSKRSDPSPTSGWVATNTRFTKDAVNYAECAGLQLLSWDTPKGNSLKERIDRLGLYPITVSTLLLEREKQFLLSRDVVLCRQLIDDHFYLDHLGVSEVRKGNILKEIESLCNT